MKKILLWLIKLYIKPLQNKPQPYTYVKYDYFSGIDDHLYGTINYLKNLSISDMLMIDIGSADGATAQLFAKSFIKSQIIGFEPIPESYKKAVNTTKHLNNVTIKNCCISDKIGFQEFYVTNNLDSSSLLKPTAIAYDNVQAASQIQVETSTLDAETQHLKSITLIKLDTQGSELMILKNAPETLKKTRFILIEMSIPKQYDNACQYFEIDDYLRSQGYKLIGLFARVVGIVEYDALYENINVNKK